MISTMPHANDRDDHPHRSGRGTASSGCAASPCAARCVRIAGRSSSASPRRLRLLPRERGRGVEHLDAAQVVVARSAHELVHDVDRVDAARQDRPAERGPEVEDVVGLVAALPRVARSVGGRRGATGATRRGTAVRRRRRGTGCGGAAETALGVVGGRFGRRRSRREVRRSRRILPRRRRAGVVEHGSMSDIVRAAAERPLHVRSLDGRQPRPRPVRARDAAAARPGRRRCTASPISARTA